MVRKEGGTVHFFVNSEDQGPAATNVPDRVYGVIDLYGQAAQATILDLSSEQQQASSSLHASQMMLQHPRSPAGGGAEGPDSEATSATIFSQVEAASDLRFHHLHGRNARCALLPN